MNGRQQGKKIVTCDDVFEIIEHFPNFLFYHRSGIDYDWLEGNGTCKSIKLSRGMYTLKYTKESMAFKKN